MRRAEDRIEIPFEATASVEVATIEAQGPAIVLPGVSIHPEPSEAGPQCHVNTRFAIALAVLLSACGACLYFVHGLQVRRSAEALRVRAESLLKQEDPRGAVQYFRQYLAFSPDDDAARRRLAETLDDLAVTRSEILGAFREFEIVLQHDPSLTDIRLEQAKRALKLDRASDAKFHVSRLLESDPQNGELNYLMGVCRQSQGEFNPAVSSYRAAITNGYRTPDVFANLTHVLHAELDRPADAEAALEQMVAANTESGEAYLVRARHALRTNDLETAAEDIRRAQELSPEDVNVHLAAVEIMQNQPRPDREALQKLELELEKYLATYPKAGRLYQALAQLQLSLDKPKQSEEWLRRGLTAIPDSFELRLQLAWFLIDRGRVEEARPYVDALSTSVPPWYLAGTHTFKQVSDGARQYLQAMMLVRKEQWREARSKLLAAQPDLMALPEITEPADLLLALCHRKLGDRRREVETLRRVLKQNPESSIAHARLAEALSATGQLQEALAHARLAAEAPQHLGTLLEVLFQAGNQGSRSSEIERIVDKALKRTPENVDLVILKAVVLQHQGDSQAALDLLERARKEHPAEVRYWIAAADVARRAEDWEQANSLLEDARRQFGDVPALRRALVAHWTNRSGDEARAALQSFEDELDRFPASDQAEILAQLAHAHRVHDRLDDAARLWSRAARLQPNDLEAQLHCFNAAFEFGDDSLITEAAKRIRQVEGPEGPYWLCAQAAQALTRAAKAQPGELLRAERLLNQVERLRPEWPIVWVLNARAEELQPRSSDLQAIADYQKALELGSRDPFVVRRLVRLLVRQVNWAEADKVIRRNEALPDLFANPEMCRLCSEVALHLGDSDRAITFARRAIETGPAGAANHVWLGQIETQVGQTAQAGESFRVATERDPASAEAWAAWVNWLVRAGQRDQAIAAVESAGEHLKTGANRLALASCYEFVENRSAAEELYAAVLADQPDDSRALRIVASFYVRTNQPEKAEPLLRKLADPDRSLPDSDADWARQALVLVLARRDYRSYREALRLLDQRIAERSSSEVREERLEKARLLAAYPDLDGRRGAVRLLEGLQREEVLPALDAQLLADLYDLSGKSNAADDLWNGLLASRSRDPALIAAFVDRCLRLRQLDAVERWIRELTTLQPQSPQTVERQVRWLAMKGDISRAAANMDRFVREENSAAADQAARLAHAAVALESAARRDAADADRAALLDEAERHFRALVPLRPEAGLLLAALLGRQGRIDEALQACEQSRSAAAPLQVTAVGIAILRAGPPRADQIALIEQWLQDALRETPALRPALIQLADLRSLQARYDEAALIYQQILRENPSSVVALNNLALLLSWQKQQHREAERLIGQAIELGGPIAGLLDSRGTIRLNAGQPEQAAKDFSAALLQSDSPRTRFRLALAQWRLRDQSAAAASLRQAQQNGFDPSELEPAERDMYRALAADLDPPQSR